jgi:glycosyltransferase involved in cell wall biosynthesis
VPFEIMMPFWGDVALFQRAVESIRAQVDPDWRLTVIDDQYPGRVHRDYLESLHDPRVRYLRNDRNLGVSGNFQRSADLAEGQHVVIMGCDDLLLPGYVARMRALLARHPEAMAVQPGVQVIDEHGAHVLPLADRVKGWYRPHPGLVAGERLAVSLLRGDWTYFPSICWSTEFLRRHPFSPDYAVVLDLAVKIEIAFDGGELLLDDEPQFLYRRHSGSVSSEHAVSGSRFHEEADFFQMAQRRATELGWTQAARAARTHFSSRLNALSRLPMAMRARDGAGIRILLAHAFRPGASRPKIATIGS